MNLIRVKKRNKNEIGISYRFSFFRLSTALFFEEDSEKLEQTVENSSPFYQLHYAHSIKPNWWFKTGVGFTNYSYSSNFQFKTQYDKTKEFEKPDGTKANKLSLRADNGFFRSAQDIQIDIPNNTDLKTGDWIFGELEEIQQMNIWQVPIGVEYRQRNIKFGWYAEASMVFNFLTFSKRDLNGKIQSTQADFPTKIVNKTYNYANSKIVIGIQGGVGLSYRLNRNLSLRTDLLFHYNSRFFNQNIQAGVGYQF